MIVVATRERGRNDEVRAWLPAVVDLREVPLTATRYRALAEVAEEARALGAGYARALVITSARAARYVPAVAGALRAGAAVWSIGPATSAALAAEGAEASATAPTAREVAEALTEGPVLVLAAREPRDELGQTLDARAVPWRSVWCYETLPLEPDEEGRRLLARATGVIVGAPSAWRVARAHVRAATWVVVPGATTAAAVRADHARVLVGWDRATGERLVELAASAPTGPA